MRLSGRLPHSIQRNEISELLAQKHSAGERILDLTESNPTRAGIAYPSDFLNGLADPRVAIYEPEPFGMSAARTAISNEFAYPVDRVVLTASTSEAYSWLFKLLCDPGDEVLIPRPSYPLFEYLAAFESVEVRPYNLFYDHGWFVDFHVLKCAITERTRAVVLVNPNNPTGHFIRTHEWEELAAICKQHDLAIISDEVFAEYAINPHSDSMLTLRGLADFVLGGLSKYAGLPQLKLGWILAKDWPEPLELIADTYLSVGAPVQYALPELLKNSALIQQEIRNRVARNLTKLNRPLDIEGGWYAILPVMDEEETALRLLREHNILVQPGYFYDFERAGYLVVSLLTSPDVFDEAISRATADFSRLNRNDCWS